MNVELIYEAAYDAARQALEDAGAGGEVRISRRMVDGRVVFVDAEGRTVKETAAVALFRKVTSVRDKLRVMEQKINGNSALSATDKAELQAYLTRCYGSLTTFNFLFRDAPDRFKGTGG